MWLKEEDDVEGEVGVSDLYSERTSAKPGNFPTGHTCSHIPRLGGITHNPASGSEIHLLY